MAQIRTWIQITACHVPHCFPHKHCSRTPRRAAKASDGNFKQRIQSTRIASDDTDADVSVAGSSGGFRGVTPFVNVTNAFSHPVTNHQSEMAGAAADDNAGAEEDGDEVDL